MVVIFHNDTCMLILILLVKLTAATMRFFLCILCLIFLIYQAQSSCQEVNDTDRQNVCRLPKIIGSCKLKQRRFYYNYTINECHEFFYEGCAGNRNNFKSKEACEALCKNLE